MNNVREITQKIKTYDNVDSTVRENLIAFSKIPDKDIENLLESCSIYKDFARNNSESKQQQAHLLGLTIFGHEATNLILNLNLESESDEFEFETFAKMSEIYASK